MPREAERPDRKLRAAEQVGYLSALEKAHQDISLSEHRVRDANCNGKEGGKAQKRAHSHLASDLDDWLQRLRSAAGGYPQLRRACAPQRGTGPVERLVNCRRPMLW